MQMTLISKHINISNYINIIIILSAMIFKDAGLISNIVLLIKT